MLARIVCCDACAPYRVFGEGLKLRSSARITIDRYYLDIQFGQVGSVMDTTSFVRHEEGSKLIHVYPGMVAVI